VISYYRNPLFRKNFLHLSGGQMNFSLSFKSFLGIFCLILSAGIASADTIKLKNGSVIRGKVSTYNDREFTVLLDLSTKRSSSRMVIAIEDIESIIFDDSPGGTSTDHGSTDKPYQPVPAPPKKPDASGETPVGEKSLGVLAAADWTSTEITVRKGQRVVITSSGTVDIGGSRRTGPDGAAGVSDSKKLMPDRPTGSLIAVVGDDNDDFIPIGSGTEFIATRDGILFLSVNEGDLRDNSGSFTTRVRVYSR
jgi:hypothetical protein